MTHLERYASQKGREIREECKKEKTKNIDIQEEPNNTREE
jgi:hypothetical protein